MKEKRPRGPKNAMAGVEKYEARNGHLRNRCLPCGLASENTRKEPHETSTHNPRRTIAPQPVLPVLIHDREEVWHAAKQQRVAPHRDLARNKIAHSKLRMAPASSLAQNGGVHKPSLDTPLDTFLDTP